MILIAVRHDVNNLESSVVLQELELARKRALYGRKENLGLWVKGYHFENKIQCVYRQF